MSALGRPREISRRALPFRGFLGAGGFLDELLGSLAAAAGVIRFCLSEASTLA
jgi:hypothetical protein